MAGRTFPSGCGCTGVADAARIDPALTPQSRRRARSPGRLGLAGPVLANVGVAGDIYLDPRLKGADRQRALDAALAIYRAHPQVAAVFSQRRDCAQRRADRRPGRLVADPARRAPRSIPSARATSIVVLKPHVTPIADTDRLCRDPRQPVGLRPPRADPVLAPGLGRQRPRGAGRDRRHHADAGRDDRPCRSPPARSTAIASTALQRSSCPPR